MGYARCGTRPDRCLWSAQGPACTCAKPQPPAPGCLVRQLSPLGAHPCVQAPWTQSQCLGPREFPAMAVAAPVCGEHNWAGAGLNQDLISDFCITSKNNLSLFLSHLLIVPPQSLSPQDLWDERTAQLLSWCAKHLSSPG